MPGTFLTLKVKLLYFQTTLWSITLIIPIIKTRKLQPIRITELLKVMELVTGRTGFEPRHLALGQVLNHSIMLPLPTCEPLIGLLLWSFQKWEDPPCNIHPKRDS